MLVFSLSQKRGVLNIFFDVNCGNSIFSTIHLVLFTVYKLVLHAIAVVLAFLIRNVKVSALNDSQETVTIIYASTILLLANTLVITTVFQFVDTISIVWSMFLFCVGMVHLLVTYVPKVSVIKKNLYKYK